MVTKPEQTLTSLGVSYDGPADIKKIDIASLGKEPKPVYIAIDLQSEEEQELIQLLKEFCDVFAWSYKDLKGWILQYANTPFLCE